MLRKFGYLFAHKQFSFQNPPIMYSRTRTRKGPKNVFECVRYR